VAINKNTNPAPAATPVAAAADRSGEVTANGPPSSSAISKDTHSALAVPRAATAVDGSEEGSANGKLVNGAATAVVSKLSNGLAPKNLPPPPPPEKKDKEGNAADKRVVKEP